MSRYGRLKGLADAVSKNLSENQDDGIGHRSVEAEAESSNFAKAINHRLNMLTSILMTSPSGKPSEMTKHAKYWSEVVDIVAEKIKIWHPERRGELKPYELANLESATRLIARDGLRSGKKPADFLEPFLKAPFLDENLTSFTDKPKQTESAHQIFSNLKGVQQSRKAINSLMRGLEGMAEKTLEDIGVERETFSELLTGGNDLEQLARNLYARTRVQVQIVAKHLAENYQDPTLANQITVSNLASSAMEHIQDRARHGFYPLLEETIQYWGDPLKKQSLLEQGAIMMWVEKEMNLFSDRAITVIDSHEEYLLEGLEMSNAAMLDKVKRFDQALKLNPQQIQLDQSNELLNPNTRNEVAAGSFAASLAKSGVSIELPKENASSTLDSIIDQSAPDMSN